MCERSFDGGHIIWYMITGDSLGCVLMESGLLGLGHSMTLILHVVNEKERRTDRRKVGPRDRSLST